MRQATRHTVLTILSVFTLAACNDPATSLADAQPAAGAQLQEFSRQWNDKVDLGRAAPLLQRYCVNMSGAPCAPDIIDRLRQYGFNDGAAGVDLAYAFIRMGADAKDGVADQKASDEDFVSSCYRVMFGREPDADGAAHHLGTIKEQGEGSRRALAMAFLRSPEFNSQK
jgi:hypothetical protein